MYVCMYVCMYVYFQICNMMYKFIILCGRYRFFFFLIVLPWFGHVFSNTGRFGHKRKLPFFFFTSSNLTIQGGCLRDLDLEMLRSHSTSNTAPWEIITKHYVSLKVEVEIRKPAKNWSRNRFDKKTLWKLAALLKSVVSLAIR